MPLNALMGCEVAFAENSDWMIPMMAIYYDRQPIDWQFQLASGFSYIERCFRVESLDLIVARRS